MNYPHVARAFYNTPWFLTREKMAEIHAFLAPRVLSGARAEISPAQIEYWQAAQAAAQARAQRAPGAIAVIPIFGVLLPRADQFDQMSGATSVQALTGSFRAALANPDVKTIVFDVDSPGGSVAGIEEFAAEIFAARGQKKMVAVSDTSMASAAYYLASAADEVVASPSSDTGSIGVISLHLDFSKAAEMAGVKPTWITYGAYKAEGNDLQPLTEEAQAFWQQRVNDYGEMFVKAVARNRGVSAKDVRANFGQGRSFGAVEAKQRGLADRIASFDETMARLQAAQRDRNQTALRKERLAIAARS